MEKSMLGRKNRKRSGQLFYPSEAKIGKRSQQKLRNTSVLPKPSSTLPRS
jgi:hypothetical protein